MIDHNAKIGQPTRDFHNRIADPRIEFKIVFNKLFKSTGHLAQIFALPGMGTRANTQKKRIGCQAIEMIAKILGTRIEIAHQPHDKRIIFNHIEHPLIVFHPGTRLDNNSPRNIFRRDQCSIVFGHNAAINLVIGFGKGHTLWASGIVNMDMRINNHQLLLTSSTSICWRNRPSARSLSWRTRSRLI